jgi:histidinol-phosphate aminotransferase
MYEIYAAATGARLIAIPAGDDFCFPTREVLSSIGPRTRFIAVGNPNNPTGLIASPHDLLAVARAAPDAAFLVDEAYFEFCGETVLPAWREVPNLFVARTFSKAYGLAGLRIGVLAGAPEEIAMVRRVCSPYNVNAAALASLPSALADHDYLRRYVEEVCRGREQVAQELHSWGIPYWPSRANFVLARMGTFSPIFISRMREQGILVRDRSHDFGCEGCVRITLGTLQHTEHLLAALRTTLREIGMPETKVV